MPEIAEVRITSDYINQLAKGKTFYTARKNPVHKGLELELYDTPFKISSNSASPRHRQRIDIEIRKQLTWTQNFYLCPKKVRPWNK